MPTTTTPPGPVLFVTWPESGLCNPTMVLAAELARRGTHEVWFATDEVRRADVEAMAEIGPVHFASLGEPIPELASGTWDDATYRAVTGRSRFRAHRAVLRQSMDPRVRVAKHRRLEEVVDEVRPALMVVESMCRIGHEVAITRGIPYVLGSPFLASNLLTSYVPGARSLTPRGFPVPHSGLPARMTRRQRIANSLFRWRTLAAMLNPRIARLLAHDEPVHRELGNSPACRGYLARVEQAELVLCYSAEGIDYPFPLPDRMRLVGTQIPPLPECTDGTDHELTAWLDAHPSVVLAGFGTVTRLERDHVHAMVEVARRLRGRHHLLWKLPADQHRHLPDGLPDNLRVESWLPSQLDVLAHPHVRAFLSHAGGNGFHEGMHFGKPQVIRPLWVDCHDQAVRGADLGVSLTLERPHTLDADDVVDKLERVLGDPSFTERARAAGARLRAAGGRVAATDLITALPALTG